MNTQERVQCWPIDWAPRAQSVRQTLNSCGEHWVMGFIDGDSDGDGDDGDIEKMVVFMVMMLRRIMGFKHQTLNSCGDHWMGSEFKTRAAHLYHLSGVWLSVYREIRKDGCGVSHVITEQRLCLYLTVRVLQSKGYGVMVSPLRTGPTVERTGKGLRVSSTYKCTWECCNLYLCAFCLCVRVWICIFSVWERVTIIV